MKGGAGCYGHRARSGTTYCNSPIRLIADVAIRPNPAYLMHRGSPTTQRYTIEHFARRSDDVFFGLKFQEFITSNLRLAISQALGLGTSSPFIFQLPWDHPSPWSNVCARRRWFEIRHFGEFHNFCLPTVDVVGGEGDDGGA